MGTTLRSANGYGLKLDQRREGVTLVVGQLSLCMTLQVVRLPLVDTIAVESASRTRLLRYRCVRWFKQVFAKCYAKAIAMCVLNESFLDITHVHPCTVFTERRTEVSFHHSWSTFDQVCYPAVTRITSAFAEAIFPSK